MKIRYEVDEHVRATKLQHLGDGVTFILDDDSQFSNYLYMMMRLSCAGLTVAYNQAQMIPVVNLKSGTTRLMDGSTRVTIMTSEVHTKRQRRC